MLTKLQGGFTARGIIALRLVTAWYHMPRSCSNLIVQCPRIDIIAHPVFPDGVKPERWWARRGIAAPLVREYGKRQAPLRRPFVERLYPVENESQN
jgi:hypothetical protein